MGLFGKIFDKKICDICGGEIGLLGNRKLDDGNLCKNCAKKLSPFFSERRRSTVEQIKEQLEYRENNLEDVKAFNTTRTFGRGTKIYVDDSTSKFMVTSAKNLVDANPDVIDFKDVTGCDIDIDEDTSEEYTTNSEGSSVSYNPPRYNYYYDFTVIIHVNNPYFNEIKVKLNNFRVCTTNDIAVIASNKPLPDNNIDYKEFFNMANEIKEMFTSSRDAVREAIAESNAPKKPVICKCCGATTIPTANGACEYCGGPVA